MTVKRVRNSKKRHGLIKFGLFLYMGFCLFAIVWLKAAVVNLEYELGELEGLRARLTNEREVVMAQKSSFLSMGNVERLATRRLGMRYADREKLFIVKRTLAAGPHRASAN